MGREDGARVRHRGQHSTRNQGAGLSVGQVGWAEGSNWVSSDDPLKSDTLACALLTLSQDPRGPAADRGNRSYAERTRPLAAPSDRQGVRFSGLVLSER
jgi:hypothetical protein